MFDDVSISRFWSKVDKRGPDECWPWMGAKSRKGYGRYFHMYRDVIAHRLSFFIAHGKMPDGVTDHLCRNRLCVNPAHLEDVTNKENVLRGVGLTAINAKKTHCKNGHELSGENLLKSALNKGMRNCKICHATYMAEYKRKRRAVAQEAGDE